MLNTKKDIGTEPEETEYEKWIENADNYAKKETRAIDNIPTLVEEGKNFIYPQRIKEWYRCVVKEAVGIEHGDSTKEALACMKLLDKGESLQQVYDAIGGEPPMMRIVVRFCKKGPEYYRFVNKPLNLNDEKFLKEIEEENKQFAQELESKQGGTEPEL